MKRHYGGGVGRGGGGLLKTESNKSIGRLIKGPCKHYYSIMFYESFLLGFSV